MMLADNVVREREYVKNMDNVKMNIFVWTMHVQEMMGLLINAAFISVQ